MNNCCASFGKARKRGRLTDTIDFPQKIDTNTGVDNIDLSKEYDWQIELGHPEGHYGGNERELAILENRQRKIHYALGGDLVDLDHWATAIRHEDWSGSNTPPSLQSSDEVSQHHQDSFNYYPSRIESAEVIVSLVSARTSKKIRRLPPPGKNELEKLQVADSYIAVTLRRHFETFILFCSSPGRQIEGLAGESVHNVLRLCEQEQRLQC